MRAGSALLGLALVAVAFLDAVKTTLSAGAGGGPLTRRVGAMMWRLTTRAGRWDATSPVLGSAGPVILLATVLVWVALLWTGWTLVFLASDGAVRDADGSPASVAARVYFAGFVIFTLGVGDVVPGEGLWQVLTAVASFLGLFLITLSITYLVSVVSAAVGRRRLAQSVTCLGETGDRILLLHWAGHGFDAQLGTRMASLVDAVLLMTQQHLAYPVLHSFHARDPALSAPRALAALDDMLVLASHGVAAEVRPAAATLEPLRAALDHYSSTVRSAGTPEPHDAPLPPLEALCAAGVPVVTREAYLAGAQSDHDRRRLMHELVAGDGWRWPYPTGDGS